MWNSNNRSDTYTSVDGSLLTFFNKCYKDSFATALKSLYGSSLPCPRHAGVGAPTATAQDRPATAYMSAALGALRRHPRPNDPHYGGVENKN